MISNKGVILNMLEIEDFLNRKSCIEIRIETKNPALEFNQAKINIQVDELVSCLCDNCSSGFIDRLFTVLTNTDGVDLDDNYHDKG